MGKENKPDVKKINIITTIDASFIVKGLCFNSGDIVRFDETNPNCLIVERLDGNKKPFTAPIVYGGNNTQAKIDFEILTKKNTLDNVKGAFHGKCNITACTTNLKAIWYNHSTQLYYCEECAERLNNDPYNKRDAVRLYGHDLCTKSEHV